MFRSTLILTVGSVALSLLANSAQAESANAEVSLSQASVQLPRLPKGRPTKNYFELGVLGGLLFPSKNHALQDRNPQPFDSPVPELGTRAGFYPLAYVGVEAEGTAGPTKTESGRAAGLWGGRFQAVLQLPVERLTPFVVLGGGWLGAGSTATGTDVDPALHFGAGAKWSFDDFVAARLDVRDNMSQKQAADKGTPAHHPEVQLGLAFTLDLRSKPVVPPPPPDADKDGVLDANDKCVNEAGVAPDGCPLPVDSDKDGVVDPRDACPTEAGLAPTGCPDLDPDHDCVPVSADKCPTDAGIAPDGCPDPDPDHDGVQGAADKCPTELETKNGFQDEDGCPDVLPEAVKKYSGVIPGIEFDLGSAKIRPVSKAVLDGALAMLKEYPELRIGISGHTDNVGDHDKNVNLSKDRAESMKAYFVEQGVDASRIEARGAGPDEPVADNKAAAGRQKNRRIEFKLLSK